MVALPSASLGEDRITSAPLVVGEGERQHVGSLTRMGVLAFGPLFYKNLSSRRNGVAA